jgi:hypothetical protein
MKNDVVRAKTVETGFSPLMKGGVRGGLILLLCFFLLLSCSERAAQCPLCERDVHQGMQVSIKHNSIPMQTCCMACALTYQAQTKNVEIIAATDFLTNTKVDPGTAFYVIGSDISPCMQDSKVQKFVREPHSALHACYDRCEPGILGFRNKKDAQEFLRNHGGSIYQFNQLAGFLPVKGKAHHD